MAERGQRGAALLAALLLLGAAGPAPAQGSHADLHLGEVSVSLDRPWPGNARKGYSPLLVEVGSRASTPQQVTFRVSHPGFVAQRTSKTLVVEPGRRERFELLVPSFLYRWSTEVWVEVESGGETERAMVVGPSHNASGDPGPCVLWVTESMPGPGEAEKWSAAIAALLQGNLPQGSPGSAVNVVPILREHLSQRPESYTSLDAVIVDSRAVDPPYADLEVLLAAARMGGRVAFIGPGALELPGRASGLEPWAQPRFSLGSSDLRVQAFDCGLGLVVLAESTAQQVFADVENRELVRDLLRRPVPIDSRAEARRQWPAVGGLDVPLRALTFGLVVFVLLIGPVNFRLVRRFRRPALIVLTVPLVALLTSVGMLAYGMFHQGLDIKLASDSFTVLDQQSHRGTSAEYRQVFVGLLTGKGLTPRAGTAVLPRHVEDLFRTNPRPFRIEQDEGVVLSGQYLPPRTPVDQLVLSDGPERARLVVVRFGEHLRVENALGAELESLLLRDDRGAYHWFGGRIEEGAAVELTPLGSTSLDVSRPELASIREALQKLEQDLPRGMRLDLADLLPPGSYFTTLGHNPFLDPMGQELTPVSVEHRLLGILPLTEELWR